MTRPAARAAGLLALAAAGLIGVSTAASAATAGTPFVPRSFAPRTFGPAAASPQTQTVGYPFVCDFSGYGGSVSANQSASFSVPHTVAAGDPASVTFALPAIPLPQAVAQHLASATSYQVDLNGVAAADASGAAVKIVSYPGVGGVVTSTQGEIPPALAVDSVTFRRTGTAHISDPLGFVITPSAGDTAMAPIKCSNPTASVISLDINVTATPAPTPPPPSTGGPVYTCTFAIPGIPGGPGGPGPITAPLPMTISATGPRTTGSTDEVTLSSGSDGLGATYPQGTTALAFSGTLPVTGAQHGAVVLRKYTTSTSSTTFRVSGPLYLAKPGTDHILFPNQFTFTIFGPTNPATGKPLSIALSCQSEASTVALTLKVTGKAAAGGGKGGTEANGAVPAGAPNTGGGPGPGSDLPMAVGGAALLLIGGGFVVVAARRRRGQAVS